MKDLSNLNNIELSSQNEEVRENELFREDELFREKENVLSLETVNDEEDNGHAKSTSGEEEEKDEKDDKQENSDQSSQSSSSAGGSGGAAGAAGAGAAAVVVVAIIITTAISGITALFNKIETFGTYFDFILTVSMEYTETEDTVVDFNNIDTGIVLMVTKNGFSKSVKLVSGSKDLGCDVVMTPIPDKEGSFNVSMTFSGTVDGLEEGTRYKLAVVGDEEGKTVTYATEEIKTTARVSEFRSLASHCSCDKDGNFNFTLETVDENGFYTDFSYEFKNSAGETVRSGIIEDPSEEQHIGGVDELPGTDYVLVIHFVSSAETDVKADHVITEFEGTGINVEIDKGNFTVTSKVKI